MSRLRPGARDIEPFPAGRTAGDHGPITSGIIHESRPVAGEHRWVPPVALATAVGSAALAVATIVVSRATTANGDGLYRFARSDLVIGLVFPAVGALVLLRQPRNRCGWVLLSTGLLGVSAFAHQWAYDGGAQRSLPGVPVATWLAAWTYMPYWLQPTLLPVLFPDGDVFVPRWRRFVLVVLAVAALGTAVSMFKPDPDVEGLGLANPLGVGPPDTAPAWLGIQYGAVSFLFLVASPVAIAGLLLRQRRAVGRPRAQLQWLLFGFTSFLILSVVSLFAGRAEDVVVAVALLMIPASVAVAVLRHGLLDIELVVNRTILYAALSGLGVAAYAALIATVGSWAGDDHAQAPLIAAVVVAVAALARSRLQKLIDHWLFGARRDPYEIVDRVGAQTATASGPTEAVARLVTALREALALPYAAVEPNEAGGVGFSSGRAPAEVEELPLVDRGRRIGSLRVGHRHHGEEFRPEERSALNDVARRASVLIQSAAMAADLQRSRERLVLAREEERRRLRRELHDGLGPELAGMALQVEGLAARLGADPELATRAEQLGDRLQQAVDEVRRVVDGLRPAAVDELGLAAAMRQLGWVDGAGPVVAVDVPSDFGELPAAVEVAAYRIAAEALNNAVRHSGAAHCTVRGEIDGECLLVEVTDDGRGFGTDIAVGVGLQSLHDRAAEVGGTLSVASAPGAGTTISARLPMELP